MFINHDNNPSMQNFYHLTDTTENFYFEFLNACVFSNMNVCTTDTYYHHITFRCNQTFFLQYLFDIQIQIGKNYWTFAWNIFCALWLFYNEPQFFSTNNYVYCNTNKKFKKNVLAFIYLFSLLFSHSILCLNVSA